MNGTLRKLPVDMLPPSIAVQGDEDADYGTYVRYTDDTVSVHLADQEEAERFAAELRDREDVAHAEAIIRG